MDRSSVYGSRGEEDKRLAIASMDLIYSNAGFVVVVLEYIRLSENEEASLFRAGIVRIPNALPMQALVRRNGGLLESYTMEDRREIAKLIIKILSSRWFTRA